MSEQILIVTNSVDYHTDVVIQNLHEQGLSFFRLNTDRFFSDFKIELRPAESFFQIRNTKNGRIISSKDVKTLWWRRPEDPVFDDSTPKHLHEFLSEECFSALHSIIACLEQRDVLFVSHPMCIRNAKNKTRQQIVAKEIGLQVSPQLITNNKDSLENFAKHQPCVVKPLSSTLEINLEGSSFGLYCNSVKPETIKEVEFDIHLFQQRLFPIREIRATCFGDTCLAVSVQQKNGKQFKEVDWRRMDIDEMTFPVVDDFPCRDMCFEYLRRFELNFGAFDFIETEEGYHFLECNQNGQWLFCDLDGANGLVKSFVKFLAMGKSIFVSC
jgi:hypothetical protein